MNPLRRWLVAGLGLAACAPVVFGGCRREKFLVDLPHGFKGTVYIYCTGPKTDGDRTVAVDAGTGTGEVSCPVHHTNPTIVQDGQNVTPNGDVVWDTTGDGMLSDLRFTVQ